MDRTFYNTVLNRDYYNMFSNNSVNFEYKLQRLGMWRIRLNPKAHVSQNNSLPAPYKS
jgi:hypothetical protein